MVVFTLTGLDTNVQLTQHPEYPQYSSPSITASYFLDLSMNILDLSGVFFFSTTHPDESTLIFPVYVLDFSNDYGKTTNTPLLNYNQADSKINFYPTSSDITLFNGETSTGFDNTAYYWQDISNSIVSDPYSYLYGAFAFTNSTNTGTGYIEYTLNTTSTTGGFVELKIKPNNRARKYFNVTSANNTIELAIVTTSNYSSVAENPIPVNTTQTFTIPEKNYSVLQLEEVINSLLSSNYILAVYNEQSNKFTFSRLNYDFQIGGTAKEWLGFSSSTITDNISSSGLLVSTIEILDSAGSISIYVNNVLQTEWSNNLNMATGTIPLVYRYSFNDGEILKVDSNNLGGFAIYWVKIIHRDTVFNDDMAFRAESSYWPDISFSEGIISDCVKSDILTYSVPKTTKTIGPAWLAKNITGGYNNSDIFSNENQLVQSYVDLNKRKNIVVEGHANVSANFGSYKYYRLVINESLPRNTDNASPHIYPGLFRIYPYNENGIKVDIDDSRVSPSTTIQQNGNVSNLNNPLPTSSSSISYWRTWHPEYTRGIADDSIIEDAIDNFGSGLGIPLTNNVSGQYVEWYYDSSTTLSKLEVYMATTPIGNGTYSTWSESPPPKKLVLFGSNDGSIWSNINSWSSGDAGIDWKPWYSNHSTATYTTNPVEFQSVDLVYYTLSLGYGIKDELINKIDNAGNVENPLSNINNDVTNVSREIVNSMLDSSDPEVVQRVHTMIENNQIAYPYQSHNVTVNDSSNCVIDGEINPTITLVRGLTYDFILNNSDTTSEPPIYNDGSLNTIFRDNKFLLATVPEYHWRYDSSHLTHDNGSTAGNIRLSTEGLYIPHGQEAFSFIFKDIKNYNLESVTSSPYPTLISLGPEMSQRKFRISSRYGKYRFHGNNNDTTPNITVDSTKHTLIVSYNGINTIRLVKIDINNNITSEENTISQINTDHTTNFNIAGNDVLFGETNVNSSWEGTVKYVALYKHFISSDSEAFNLAFGDSEKVVPSVGDDAYTIFTPDLPIENVDSIYYQDGLSFYLDASTNHVSDDDYTQVAMPLFYSDVSYSTTEGYPITWENSNYRKIRFTVPFDAPDTLSIISQDSNNNNFSGQINIITNTYLPWIPITFGHNDVLQFRLTYKADLITDSNGVALDSTGVKLGTNSVENQDYVARLTLKIPEIIYDFTNHADNTAAFTYLNSTDLSHNLVEFTDGYEDSTNGIAFDGSGNNGYIEILNFPGNSGTIIIKYGANDSGDALQENYIMLIDNVNNNTKIHQITSTVNSFTTIYSVTIPYNKTTKSIKIAEESGIILLEKITIQQIF